MPTPPKASPQADGTPESLHETEKKTPAQRAHRDTSDEHLGAKENQVSNTSPPAGQEYTDEPKQG